MHVDVEQVTALRFADGSPVRAASAVVRLADGLLVVQDDATHAAWLRGGGVERVRALPPVRGLDTFEESAGTKALKPDLEAGFEVDGGAVLLGSGSSSARTRCCLVRFEDGVPASTVADLAPLYDAAARALDVPRDLLNLEGACVVGDVVRWFHRGLPSAGVPTASVDVGLAALLAALAGEAAAADVPVHDARRYDLGTSRGVGLAVTDAVRLPDGHVLVSAAAEDTPDPRDDGPVVASELAVLDAAETPDPRAGTDDAERTARGGAIHGGVAGGAVHDGTAGGALHDGTAGGAVHDGTAGGAVHGARERGRLQRRDAVGGGVLATCALPHIDGAVPKVEGLTLLDAPEPGDSTIRLFATLDADDPTAPSLAVTLLVRR